VIQGTQYILEELPCFNVIYKLLSVHFTLSTSTYPSFLSQSDISSNFQG